MNGSAFPGSATPAANAPIAGATAKTFAIARASPAIPSDGGFATHLIADARYCFPLGEAGEDVAIAPLLCAGLIGWRSLVMAGDGRHLGIYGFGAAGHIIAQVARWQGRSVYAFTRPGDIEAQRLAKSLDVDWTGGSEQQPPVPLDAAIIYAPVGSLVPWRCGRCARVGAWSAPASTCRIFRPFLTECFGKSGNWSPSPTSRAVTGSSSSRSQPRRASRPTRRHSRCGKPMRFCQACDWDRSLAPPCYNHDPATTHRYRDRLSSSSRVVCLIFSKTPDSARQGGASGSIPMPRWSSSAAIVP